MTIARGALDIAYAGNKISLTNGSKTASVNGNTVTLSEAITISNGKTYGPIREIGKHIGLHTRVSRTQKRFEIANYPLDISLPSGAWFE